MKLVKKQVKNEKGFTLVELLAVVVILGIIAAIAIPAIGTIMKNSEKDAHVVNAKQAANAMRMYVAENAEGTATAFFKDLENGGYLENLSDPSNKKEKYNLETSKVVYTAPTTSADGKTKTAAKYVVTLIGKNNVNYIITDSRDKNASELGRDDIQLNNTPANDN